jgi:hypothetical protein
MLVVLGEMLSSRACIRFFQNCYVRFTESKHCKASRDDCVDGVLSAGSRSYRYSSIISDDTEHSRGSGTLVH